MKAHRVASTRRIAAPAAEVYRIIADYRDEHPHILPRKWFTKLDVESGGIGAGTTIRFEMRMFGGTRQYRAAVTEPEPGRVLVETDANAGTSTRFIVNAVDGDSSDVTFETTLSVRNGLEGWLAGRFLRRVYAEELKLLEQRAKKAA